MTRPSPPGSRAAAGKERAQQQLRAVVVVRSASDSAATTEAIASQQAGIGANFDELNRTVSELGKKIRELEPAVHQN